MIGAVLCCCTIATLYVGSLYAWRRLPRDHPSTIVRRMISVACFSTVAWIPAAYTLQKSIQGPVGAGEVLEELGIRTSGLAASTVLPLLLTALAFAGPLAYLVYVDGLSSHGFPLGSLFFWRNYVVAPITEEFVFRSCMVPILTRQGFPFTTTVLMTPLFFGAAHLHHLRELLTFGGVDLPSALQMVMFQFMYTVVFGWYATYLLLRTRHLLGPILVHSFCNWMGFPPLVGLSNHPQHALFQTVTAAGLLSFALLLAPMTAPALYKE